MTDDQLHKRVKKWRKRLTYLGVGHFRIISVEIVEEVPGADGSIAGVGVNSQYDQCRFWFTQKFLDGVTEQELDETIIHEWIHVSMRDFDELTTKMREEWLPDHILEQYNGVELHHREGFIDRMARQLYAFHSASK